jgi:hypothetical protein
MSMFSSVATSSVCASFIRIVKHELKTANTKETKRVLERILKQLKDLKGSADAGYE